jgi:hypothetical protein
MRYVIATMLAFSCAACSSNRPAVVRKMDQPQTDGPVIARIVGRHDVIVVRAGAEGATYSLETKQGKTLVPAQTLGNLAMSKPGLGRKVRTMQASADYAGLE